MYEIREHDGEVEGGTTCGRWESIEGAMAFLADRIENAGFRSVTVHGDMGELIAIENSDGILIVLTKTTEAASDETGELEPEQPDA
jgi:hypothetical protein